MSSVLWNRIHNVKNDWKFCGIINLETIIILQDESIRRRLKQDLEAISKHDVGKLGIKLELILSLRRILNKLFKKANYFIISKIIATNKLDHLDYLTYPDDILSCISNSILPVSVKSIKSNNLPNAESSKDYAKLIRILDDLNSENKSVKVSAFFELITSNHMDPSLENSSNSKFRNNFFMDNISFTVNLDNIYVGSIIINKLIRALFILLSTKTLVLMPIINSNENYFDDRISYQLNLHNYIFININALNKYNEFAQKLTVNGREAWNSSLDIFFDYLGIYRRKSLLRELIFEQKNESRVLSNKSSNSTDSTKKNFDSSIPDPKRFRTEDLESNSKVESFKQIFFEKSDLNCDNYFKILNCDDEQKNVKFNGTLFPFQITALNWMIDREEKVAREPETIWDKFEFPKNNFDLNIVSKLNPDFIPWNLNFNFLTKEISLANYPTTGIIDSQGGILADEMGFGKTVETLALICYKHYNRIDKRDIDPSQTKINKTLIITPLSVMGQWVSNIKCFCPNIMFSEYHGTPRIIDNDSIIYITTYGTLLNDYNKNSEESLYSIEWERIVLDEAHIIKNKSSKVAKACFQLRALSRWCVTGTPLQNQIDEIRSFLIFLRIQPWSESYWWNQIINSGPSHIVLSKCARILQKIMLRRTKHTLNPLTKQPLVKLPKCTYYQLFLRTSRNKVYDKYNKFAINHFIKQKHKKVLTYLLRMRQACCSPFLVDAFEENEVDLDENLCQDEYVDMFSKKECFLDEKCYVCSEYSEFSKKLPCDHFFCKNCIENHIFRISDKNSTNENHFFLLCPACGKEFDQNIIGWTETAKNSWIGKIKNTPTNLLMSDKLMVALTLTINLLNKGKNIVIFSQWVKILDIFSEILERYNIKYDRLDGCMTKNDRNLCFTSLYDKYTIEKPSMNPIELSDCLPTYEFEKKDYIGYLIPNDNNIVEACILSKKSDLLCTLQRKNYILLLASLKAVGTGVNLIFANTMILLDSWWNPTVEAQAIQRILRISQRSDVHIFNLLIEKTIEENLQKLHQRKNEMAEFVFSSNYESSFKTFSKKIELLLFEE